MTLTGEGLMPTQTAVVVPNRVESGNGGYYASADAFYNNGQTSGSLHGTPFVDNNVPNC